MRLVALVAAMVVQGAIALLGVLPELPAVPDLADASDSYYRVSQPLSFWLQFALIEFIAAAVVSLAFGPGVRVSDVPVIGRLVLGLGFVAAPAALIALGAIDASQAAAGYSPAAAASSLLINVLFAMLFFGLPVIALSAQPSRATLEPTSQTPA